MQHDQKEPKNCHNEHRQHPNSVQLEQRPERDPCNRANNRQRHNRNCSNYDNSPQVKLQQQSEVTIRVNILFTLAKNGKEHETEREIHPIDATPHHPQTTHLRSVDGLVEVDYEHCQHESV